MAHPDRKPDAVIFNGGLSIPIGPDGITPAKVAAFGRQLQAANPNARFGPVLGCRRVKVYDGASPLRANFAHDDDQPWQPIFFPDSSPYAGRSRHEWYVATEQPDGTWAIEDTPLRSPEDHDGRVLFGWLRPEAIEG